MTQQMQFSVGDRLRMLKHADAIPAVAAGALGTINGAKVIDSPMVGSAFTLLSVLWDDGRTLAVIVPPDQVEVANG